MSSPDQICPLIIQYLVKLVFWNLLVTTKDSYIFSLHRIPNGQHSDASDRTKKKIAVLLQHGVLMDGIAWLLNFLEDALGYILANSSFNVWILTLEGMYLADGTRSSLSMIWSVSSFLHKHLIFVQVFRCVDLTCGRFYHPKVLHTCYFGGIKQKQQSALKRLLQGNHLHVVYINVMFVYKQKENREVEELQFAVCRRCPKSNHRKCLPRRHKVEEDLGNPLRIHIIFPEIIENIKISDMLKC